MEEREIKVIAWEYLLNGAKTIKDIAVRYDEKNADECIEEFHKLYPDCTIAKEEKTDRGLKYVEIYKLDPKSC